MRRQLLLQGFLQNENSKRSEERNEEVNLSCIAERHFDFFLRWRFLCTRKLMLLGSRGLYVRVSFPENAI